MAAGECRVSPQEIMQAQRPPIMCDMPGKTVNRRLLVLHPGLRHHGHRTLTGQAQAEGEVVADPVTIEDFIIGLILQPDAAQDTRPQSPDTGPEDWPLEAGDLRPASGRQAIVPPGVIAP